MSTSSRELLAGLENRISRQEDGTIGFDDFMREALYHPQLGFYARPQMHSGHYALFSTEPATTEVYAQVMGLQIEQMWYWLDQCQPFTLVEDFSDDARFLLHLLRWMKIHRPELFDAVQVVFVEPFEQRRSRQQSTLGENGLVEKCRWVSEITELGQEHLHGVFLSTEHAGSLPVKVVQHNGADWQEQRVAWSPRHAMPVFQSAPIPAECPLREALKRWQVPAVRNFRAEVCLELEPWLQNASAIFDAGFLILIDLGYDADTLYHPNRINGSLKCRGADRKNTNPLAEPGSCDIQCAVNFSALEALAMENGLVNLGTLRHSDAMRALAHQSYTAFRDEQGPKPAPEAARVLQAFRHLLFPPIQSSSYRLLILADGFDPNDPPHLACYGSAEDATEAPPHDADSPDAEPSPSVPQA